MNSLLALVAIWLASSSLAGLPSITLAQQNGEVLMSNKQQRGGDSNNNNHKLRGQSFDDLANLSSSASSVGSSSSGSQNDQVKIQYVNVNGLPVLVQFTYVGPPKILPIATADSYPEGSSIKLVCTVSGGQRKGLALSWTMDGVELDEQLLKYGTQTGKGMVDNISIGMDEADVSILRIKNATNLNSGVYTCQAKNPLGQDSTSVKIIINVELKWQRIPKDTEVGLNQELSIECDAIGSPSPTIEWFKHSTIDRSGSSSNGTMLVAKGKLLKLAKAQHKDSGLYECLAKNGVDEDLRKIIQVKVRGK